MGIGEFVGSDVCEAIEVPDGAGLAVLVDSVDDESDEDESEDKVSEEEDSVLEISPVNVLVGCSRKKRRYDRSMQWYHRNEFASAVLPVYMIS